MKRISNCFSFKVVDKNNNIISKGYGKYYRASIFGLSARFNGFNYEDSPELKTYVKEYWNSSWKYYSDTVDDYYDFTH